MLKSQPGFHSMPHSWPTGSRPTPTNPNPVDFGPNVLIFDPSMSMSDIQSKTHNIFLQQDGNANQFGPGRYAYLFKPGSYSLNVEVSYYTTVHGLGHLPDDVTITGGVQSLASSTQGNALNNFWRGAENLAVSPTNANINDWAVSQATYLRRFHVKGELWLYDFMTPGPNNWSSGGFIADSLIDVQVRSGSQQQFLTRNTNMTKWVGGVWNMVFVGDEGAYHLNDQAPAGGSWPDVPLTVVANTPLIREKPYLVIDSSGNYAVQVPTLKQASQGNSWSGTPDTVNTLPINQFYIAKATTDTATSINAALQQGYHLILTPGTYHLNSSLEVNYPNTVILGLGMATLTPDNGTPAMTIADVDGVSVSGILFDAGPQQSPSLLVVGPSTSNVDHSSNPTALYDLSCRVGGGAAALTQNCFTINVNNLILDNVWLWRADHGNPGSVGWAANAAQNGLTVNGQNVTAYGLFVEHFEGFQTLWNGNGGSVYFYQSEIPYDVPNQGVWQQNNEKGYPSYKVGSQVTTHIAQGLGIYCNFINDVQLDNAIETPTGPGIQMHHMVTEWLGIAAGSSINHIINGTGNAVYDNGTHMQAKSQT
jgi:hypothetical protein